MKKVKIGNIAKVFNGYAFKSTDYSDDGFQIIRITNVKNGYISNDNQKFIKLTNKKLERFVLQEGDILISLTGNVGRTGRVKKENLPAVLNQRVGKLIIKSNEVYPDYLFHILNSNTIEAKLIEKAKGIAQKNIGSLDIENIEIPLPPLEDQKRIVKVLDDADALRQKRKQAVGLLDDYLKSVFLEMFGDPVRNEKGWEVGKLGKITNKITDGTHKTPNYKTDGVKFISAKNIKEEKITWDDIKYISEKEHQSIHKRCNPERNDLLLTKSGSLGMVALVDVDFEFSLFESIALLKIKQNLVNPVYLREYLNLKEIKTFYLQRTKGVGVQHLHLIDIKSLPVLLPPKDDQQKFAEVVEKTESLKQKMLAQSGELEAQFGALVKGAFEGEG